MINQRKIDGSFPVHFIPCESLVSRAYLLKGITPLFDGAVISTKRSQAQFFVKYCIQRSFVENAIALTHQDVASFRRCFVTFSEPIKM